MIAIILTILGILFMPFVPVLMFQKHLQKFAQERVGGALVAWCIGTGIIAGALFVIEGIFHTWIWLKGF